MSAVSLIVPILGESTNMKCYSLFLHKLKSNYYIYNTFGCCI